MSESVYDRTTSICLWAAIGSAIAFQNVSGPWQILIGVLGIAAAATSMTVYFYFQSHPQDAKETSAAKVECESIEDFRRKIVEADPEVDVWLEDRAFKLLRRYAFVREPMMATFFEEKKGRYELHFRKDGSLEIRAIANPWKTSLLEEKEDTPSSMPGLRMLRSFGFGQ